MYGHVPEYLNVQAQRLRAERAETLAKTWRLTGWAFGLALACLLCVVVAQEQQLAESHAYSSHAEHAERSCIQEEAACAFELQQAKAQLEELGKSNFRHFVDLGECRESQSSPDSFNEQKRELEEELLVYSEQARHESSARDAAEYKFKVCLSANAGLVEVLREFDQTVKDQQQLIRESVELAKRCESTPVTWAETAPAGWQVVDHAR